MLNTGLFSNFHFWTPDTFVRWIVFAVQSGGLFLESDSCKHSNCANKGVFHQKNAKEKSQALWSPKRDGRVGRQGELPAQENYKRHWESKRVQTRSSLKWFRDCELQNIMNIREKSSLVHRLRKRIQLYAAHYSPVHVHLFAHHPRQSHLKGLHSCIGSITV